jgi:hypothetical protein
MPSDKEKQLYKSKNKQKSDAGKKFISDSFKEQYLKFKQPSAAREQFVYDYVTSHLTKQQIESSMKGITVPGPNGTKIKYKVMPNYISIGDFNVPMSGSTAQKIANNFGLKLPTPQQVQEIHNSADKQIPAQPLSGTGTVIDGKQYSGKDVVDKGVGYSQFASNYNDWIKNQKESQGVKDTDIVSGYAKDITAPVPGAPDKLGLYGFFDKNGKPIQGGSGQTPHDTSIHTEYGAFARLISNDVEIIYPDGTTKKVPMSQIQPNLSYGTTKKVPMSQIQPNLSYVTTKDKVPAKTEDLKQDQYKPTSSQYTASTTPATTKKEKINDSKLEKINQFLDQFESIAHSRRINIIKRAIQFRLNADHKLNDE